MRTWEIPVEYLTAASITPAAAVISGVEDHLRIVDQHSMQADVTAFTGSFLVIQLQGSLDGVIWTTLLSLAPAATGVYSVTTTVSTPARYTRVLAEPEDGSTSGTASVTAVSGNL